MAEGGYDFENQEFKRDDYDNGIDALDDKIPMVSDEPTQRIALYQSKTPEDLRRELRESCLNDQKQRLVKTFYDEILKRYRIDPPKVNFPQFSISDDSKLLFWVVDDKKLDLLLNKVKQHFFLLGLSPGEFNKIVGHGGAKAVRESFDIPYKSKIRVGPKTVAALNRVAEKANNAV